MGRTLFWYIFKDLFKIFMMANGALAGIMSFGGLLKPLTHQGLDAAQVGKLLTYFNMAMLTYSLPIAALFATTVVYGRLSADNELTACRAGGISHLTVTLPAFVLGVLVAILSLVFLCFIVPIYTLKAEQTLYSNMAKLIAGQIQKDHQIDFKPAGVTIFAREAYIPPNSGKRGQQIVVLKDPTIKTIVRPYKEDREYRIPKDFYSASEAVIYIEQREKGEQRGTGKVNLTISLTDGRKFPRQYEDAVSAGIDATSYGPMEIDSPIKEDTKFMDVWRLKKLYHNPEDGAKVRRALSNLVNRDQVTYLADRIIADLNSTGESEFHLKDGEVDILRREPTAPIAVGRSVVGQSGGLTLSPAPPAGQLATWAAGQSAADVIGAAAGIPVVTIVPVPAQPGSRPYSFQQKSPDGTTSLVNARSVRIQIQPGDDPDHMRVNIQAEDSVRRVGSDLIGRGGEIFDLDVPSNTAIKKIANRGVDFYVRIDPEKLDRQVIGREVLALSNQILAESNSRVSFAISCLVLVMMGCALGMMFRSGNFLSAFAISVVPALLTITLIVAGQRMSGNIPDQLKTDIAKYVNSPLKMGLGLIWSGNVANFVLAVVLLGRLQRK
jgi:lipopolysaccharide export LptBFGC system permease protein LptF